MANKPIFVATHPRACSTAFERVFMTCRDTLTCIHEPFGDAFYFGPERLSARYEDDVKARRDSGFSNSTYKTVLDKMEGEAAEGKRLFIKDIAHYLIPPKGGAASIASSLQRSAPRKGVGTSTDTIVEPHNPTVIPASILETFHFTFLIRHPRSSIPSYYRCTIPPLNAVTGFDTFLPEEAGYNELRRLFDYLRSVGQIGTVGTPSNGSNRPPENPCRDGTSQATICVVDADDLLHNPSGIIEAYCDSVGLPYTPGMLTWDKPSDQESAKAAFAKWHGFHEDAIESTSLRPRPHRKIPKSREDEDSEWRGKYGEDGARVIRETVDANISHYEYLKEFAIRV
ncbi:MAG: helicase [Thelocarpon superellum]|nr:MAG: helicase [Thelocarpon superellum]